MGVVTCKIVIIDTKAEFGMEAEPIAANVAVKATTTMLPTDNDNPCACNHHKNIKNNVNTLVKKTHCQSNKFLKETDDVLA